jgi:spermidine/putrescine-binding protein
MLVGRPDPRVGRRSFLQVAGLLAAAGAAGYAGGTVAGWGDDDPPGAAAAADGAPISGNRVSERLLNIYNWSDYIDDRTIPLFQAQANIRVNYDVFSSNEDLLARMKAGPTSYDIVVPTNNFVPTYLKLDLIEPLRQDLIPNLTNLDKEFVDTDYDPGNRYTVPWQWGTTGIGFNRAKVPGGKLDSWSAVFEPGSAAQGRVTLLREVTDLIGCALIYLGKSPNSIEDADLAEVVKLVRSARPRQGVHHRHLHRRAGRRRDLGRPGLERRRVPGPGPEPGRQLRHPQGGLAALRRRHGHPQGRPIRPTPPAS